MCACPCCGTDVVLTVDSITEGLFSFDLSLGGEEVDVTTFAGGRATLVCSDQVVLTVNSYCIITGVSLGDEDIPWSANVCGTLISGNATSTSITVGATATGVPSWTYIFKSSGTVTGI